jgi:4-hydroxybenzoate polyprenyltransferase
MPPYLQLMRLDQPRGIFLLAWPTLWALWLANTFHPSLALIIIFLTGIVVSRSAGCIINDIIDRKIDCQVTRTRKRPITAGIISVKQAVLLTGVLLMLDLILVLQLNIKTFLLATLGLALMSLYPFMKRYTYFPQVILGFTFNIGVLMAFSASLNTVPLLAFFIYALAILWTLSYDTIYAMVDRGSDLSIGVKSSAIWLGKYDTAAINILQSLVLMGLLVLGYAWGIGYKLCWLGAVLLSLYQAWLIKDRSPQRCYVAFKMSHYLGLLIFMGIVFSE